MKIGKNDRVLVCMRMSAVPHPPVASVRGRCCECGMAVWRAFSSPEVDHLMCAECAEPQIADPENRVLPLDDKQIADLREYYRRKKQR